MKSPKFQLFNPKKDIRALIIFGAFLIPILVNINYLLNNKVEEKSEVESSVSETNFEEVEEIEEISSTENNINTDWNNQIKIINGNIFYRNENLEEQQITFKNLDNNAVLSPDGKKIAFFRKTPNDPLHGCWFENSIIHEIWLYDLINKEEELLVSGGKVDTDNSEALLRPGDKCKDILAHFVNLKFSLDSKTIYFSHSAWVTSGAIQSVDISTREIKFVSSGNGFEVIQDGEYKGNILTSKHKYFSGGGSYDIYFVVNSEGKELLAVASEEDFYNGNLFQTSKQDRDNFLNYVKNEFSNIEYLEPDVKGVKRIVEKDECEGERIFYYLTYPEIEGEEILSSTGALGWSFGYWVGDFDRAIIKNNFFDGSLLSNDYEITLLKDSLLSVRFDFYEYSAGAAHGLHRTEVFNFKTCGYACKGEFIELEDIFKPDSDYLTVLSQISQNKIAEKFKENGDYEDYYFDDLVKGGTLPESGNLDRFNLSEDALIITFDPYEVASFSFGKQVVEIPYEEIEEYIDSDGIIKNLIKK